MNTLNEFEEQPVTINIQAVLDGIMPKIIPMALTMLLYFFLSKRGWTPLKCIVLLLVIGIIGSGMGLFPSIWP